MKHTDEFDGYLRNTFRKAENAITDDGFTEKVVGNLPVAESPVRRNLILYLACTIAVLIFIFSNGYKSLQLSVNEIFRYGFQMVGTSLISLVVISVFILVSMCIAGVEYNKS